MSRRRRILWGVLLASMVAAIWWARGRSSPSAEELLAGAQQALATGRYIKAGELAEQILARSGDSAPALGIAAHAAVQTGNFERALFYYHRLPDKGSDAEIQGRLAAADLLMQLGEPSACERQLRAVLKHRPELASPRRRLASLLLFEGRHWEARGQLARLVRSGRASASELSVLGNMKIALASAAGVKQFQKVAPTHPSLFIRLARLAIYDNDLVEAKALLGGALANEPRNVEALAYLGFVLLRAGDAAALYDWQRKLPAEAEGHPLVWTVRGEWAAKGDPAGAIRCYWEAVRRDPDDKTANYQLAILLSARGKHREAALFRNRADKLLRLEEAAKELSFDLANETKLREAAGLTAALGRHAEAAGWWRALLAAHPRATGARQELRRMEQALAAAPPEELSSANPGKQIDLAEFSMPQLELEIPTKSPKAILGRPPSPGSGAHFDEQAAEAALDFTYFNGSDPTTEGIRLLETGGGGVAVLDFDGDSWADVYFTQGCDWPPRAGQTLHLDKLFRNLGDGRFKDVTREAAIFEDRFGQGVAAGDFNDDGFADLYVANIGVNRLLCNNGDGTFSDVTSDVGVEGERWTSSCLIADLNGDTWPDLYEVNYVDVRGDFERICSDEGYAKACPPDAFDAQPDRLFMSSGDGKFVDQTDAAGAVGADGYGLGIVAADLEGTGLLSLFITNDNTPNFLFQNRTPRRGAPPEFVERGLVSGVALNRDGQAQSSMGIAAGDADGDGRIDLFVTNFYNQSSTFYRQHSDGGLFTDDTAAAALRDPSAKTLGWGAQFIDAELDGWPDLIVTNGHVDDFRFRKVPFRMRPQYYRNLGEGRFIELSPESLGPFFRGEYLGRSMARLDWDRDGREDVVISHLDEPAALLTNRTDGAGHFIALELRGTHSDRDAIGASVRLKAGGRVRTAQLMAGDGYQASNQRRLVFGLGASERIDELTVRWPAGGEETYRDLPVDVELLLLEGSDAPVRLPSAR